CALAMAARDWPFFGWTTCQDVRRPVYAFRFSLKTPTLSRGRCRAAWWDARMTGRLYEGFSAWKSSSGISASAAATAMSMSRDLRTVVKYGVLLTLGRVMPNFSGRAMMFLMAWSFGT